MLDRGLARLSLLMLEAGADEAYPSFRDAPVVTRPSDMALQARQFTMAKPLVTTVHLFDRTARRTAERPRGVDQFGRLPMVRNVHVNDASLLPDTPCVNPQATVMALAVRNTRRFLEHRSC